MKTQMMPSSVTFAGSKAPNPHKAVIADMRKALNKHHFRNVKVSVQKVYNTDTLILEVGSMKEGMAVMRALAPLMVNKPGPKIQMGVPRELSVPHFKDLPVSLSQKIDEPFTR